MITLVNLVDYLEKEWDVDGILYHIREGNFNTVGAAELLAVLVETELPEGESIHRRLVSLLWYMPLFLSWQQERVVEKGGDGAVYSRFRTKVEEQIERLLGSP